MTDSFCAGCGTARSGGLAFCVNCGRRFDTAPSVPPPVPAPASMPAPMLGPMSAPAPAPDGVMVPAAGGEQPRKPRRTGLIAGVCALVLAVAVAGFVGWRVFGSSDTATGADSPEQAVRQLVDAVADQDGLAALKLIAPGETTGLGEVYRSAQDRLEQADLTDGDMVTDAVSLSVDGLELDTENLADGAARVTVTGGTYRLSWNPDELPARLDALKDASEADSASGDLADVLHDDHYERDFGVTTVKIDGRWYVSAIGTALDGFSPVFAEEGLSPADYSVLDDDVDPIVGSTPEDVIDKLVAAINGQDIDELLANLPADLVLGARPFAPTAESALRRQGVRGEVSASDLDLETEDIGGGRVKVTIDGARFDGDVASDGDEGGYGDLTIDGGCVRGSATDRGTGYDEEYDYYDEDDTESFDECLRSYPEFADLGIDDPYVVMRKVSGGYQLDPMATVSDYARQAIEQLPGSLIDEIIDDITDEY